MRACSCWFCVFLYDWTCPVTFETEHQKKSVLCCCFMVVVNVFDIFFFLLLLKSTIVLKLSASTVKFYNNKAPKRKYLLHCTNETQFSQLQITNIECGSVRFCLVNFFFLLFRLLLVQLYKTDYLIWIKHIHIEYDISFSVHLKNSNHH